MRYFLFLAVILAICIGGYSIVSAQDTMEDTVSWIPKKYIDEYKGDSNELLWLIVLTLQENGVNMEKIETLIISDRIRQGLATPVMDQTK